MKLALIYKIFKTAIVVSIYLMLTMAQSQASYVKLLPNCDSINSHHKSEFHFSQIKDLQFKEESSKQLDSLERIYCTAMANGNQQQITISLMEMSEIYHANVTDLNSFRKMYFYLNEAISIAHENGFVQEEIRAMEIFCSKYTLNGFYAGAIEYANSILEISKKINDTTRIAESFMLLGRIYREQGNFEKSNILLHKALTYQTNTLESRRITSFTYLHLSNLRRKQLKYKESITFAKMGYDIVSLGISRQENYVKAAILIELIESKIEINDFDFTDNINELSALDNLRTSWIHGKEIYFKAILLEKQGEISEAINNYIYAFNLLSQYGINSELQKVTQNISNLIAGNQQYIGTEKLLKTLNDIFKHSIKQERDSYVFAQHLRKIKEEEANLHGLKNQLTTANKNMRFTYLAILILTVFSSILFWLFLTKRRLNSEVNKLNNELEKSVLSLSDKSINLKLTNDKLEDILHKRELLITRLKKFTTILAHDFKEPTNSIAMFSKILTKSLPNKINEEEYEFLSYVSKSSNRLLKMVDALYKHSQNTMVILDNFETINLTSLLSAVKEDLHIKIMESKTDIVINELHTISGNQVLIHQLFQNLIDNAIKYKKPQEKAIICINSVKQANKTIVSVADNGIGIKDSPNLDVFKNFQRGTENLDQPGLGIGLATCKDIIKIHGGDITFKTNENGGTTFYITFITPSLISVDSQHDSLSKKTKNKKSPALVH